MKGFTLIELLIVIAILAILTTTVVLVLNPAQKLAKTRDSQRMSDLNTVRKAIVLYLITASSPTFTSGPFAQGVTSGGCLSLSGTCDYTRQAIYLVNGTGWVGVNLGSIPSGSLLVTLPRDPVSDATYHYAYAASSTSLTFELNAVFESSDNASKMANDGGNSTSTYEIGTAPGLNL